ncbi:MAG: hypothetical protein ACI9QQ_002864 [Myxococcota bacterium]|jgi:hypothetical protein
MESFSSLMEFSVAIAGFSGVTIAGQARSDAVNELQSFRNTMLIAFSLFAAPSPSAAERRSAMQRLLRGYL